MKQFFKHIHERYLGVGTPYFKMMIRICDFLFELDVRIDKYLKKEKGFK